MKCYHCGKDLKDSWILQMAAKIMGRRSRRKLSPEQARAMAAKSAETRRLNKDERAKT